MSQPTFEQVPTAALAAKQLAALSRILHLNYADLQKVAVAELFKQVVGK
jgi:hypothetical protein